MDESTADKSGKPFTALPNSSHFFVVVGRNVDQWRASLGLEEGKDCLLHCRDFGCHAALLQKGCVTTKCNGSDFKRTSEKLFCSVFEF